MPSRKTISSLVIVVVASASLWFIWVHFHIRNYIPGTNPYALIPEGLTRIKPVLGKFNNNSEGAIELNQEKIERNLVYSSKSNVETESESKTSINELKQYVDDYGFPYEIKDIAVFKYNPSKILYKEGEYTYSLYTRETEGRMPIIKVSSSTEEYTGLMQGWQDKVSPDQKKFAFIQDSPLYDKTGNICIAQINPKVIQCKSPASENETFAVVGGNYDELLIDGNWINDSTVTFAVYRKNKPTDRGLIYTTKPKPVRMETITFIK